MSLTSSLNLTVKGLLINALDLSIPADDLTYRYASNLATGTAAGQAQQMWHDQRTVTAASENLDLAGVLTNGLGVTVTFATVRGMIIENTNITPGADLKIGGAAANQLAGYVGDAASDKIIVRSGGCLVLWAPNDGYTVTAGTGDQLKIDPAAATITYNIILIGT